MIIYKISNSINGKVYIGQTRQELGKRKNRHLSRALNECHYNYALCNAIRKYGIKAFHFEVIERVSDVDMLNEREIFWIKEYNSKCPNGYNMTDGGGGTSGYHHKEEDKVRMSKLKSNLFNGENNPFFGKSHSVAQIEKWKRERRGRKLTEEWKANISRTRLRRRIINMDTGEVFESIRHVCRHYGKDPESGTAGAISKVCRKEPRYNTVMGFRFEYYDPLVHDNTVPSLIFIEEGVTTIREE